MSTEAIDKLWETDDALVSEEIVSACGNAGLHVGELQADVLSETAMNTETRNIIKVTMEDAKKVAESFSTWMGDDIESRKDFISNNINKYASEVD